MTAPYHLCELYVRESFSENFIPIAIPLIILGLLYLLEGNHKKFLIFFVLGYTISIYSHLAMSIYFTLMILVTFFIINIKKICTKKNILYLVFAGILILLLTASFWMPLMEIKLKGDYGVFIPYFMTGKGALAGSTIPLWQLVDFTKPYTHTHLVYNLQLFVTIFVIGGVILLIKDKKWKDTKWLSIFVFTVLSIIMVTPLFPWKYAPDILQTLQFPWRLILYIDFGAILISGYFLQKFETKKFFKIAFIVIIGITLLSSFYYTRHSDKGEVDLSNVDYNLGMGNQNEYLPRKTLDSIEYFNNRSNEIITLEGSGKIEIINNDVPTLTFKASEVENLKIELPRLYYMGYILKKDGKEIELKQSDKGFLEATITEDGEYELEYEKTAIMHIGNVTSVLTTIAIIIYIIYKNKKKQKMIGNGETKD